MSFRDIVSSILMRWVCAFMVLVSLTWKLSQFSPNMWSAQWICSNMWGMKCPLGCLGLKCRNVEMVSFSSLIAKNGEKCNGSSSLLAGIGWTFAMWYCDLKTGHCVDLSLAFSTHIILDRSLKGWLSMWKHEWNLKGSFWEQDTEGGVAEGGKGKGGNEEALVRVLRELSTVQRNLANLQVELQGRQVRVTRVTVLHSSFVHPAVSWEGFQWGRECKLWQASKNSVH